MNALQWAKKFPVDNCVAVYCNTRDGAAQSAAKFLTYYSFVKSEPYKITMDKKAHTR